MVVRMILDAPNPILTAVSDPIEFPNGYVKDLASDMVQTMAAVHGKGLSAPQVGSSVRMFCMMYKGSSLVMCNPIITRRGRDTVTANEGCLSMRNIPVRMTRHRIVTVEWQDTDGVSHSRKMTGLDARCVQHEIDHLDGILIPVPGITA